MFFFEKKNQKTFNSWRSVKTGKVFLFLFLQKKKTFLSCLVWHHGVGPQQRPSCARAMRLFAMATSTREVAKAPGGRRALASSIVAV